mmetsp:Transcript_11588/g.25529  ORF Transcript_11588/g.25529 Transcript_11588/m.25529 type:complete len:210 (+) Transcript_11588:799-1428(+)
MSIKYVCFLSTAALIFLATSTSTEAASSPFLSPVNFANTRSIPLTTAWNNARCSPSGMLLLSSFLPPQSVSEDCSMDDSNMSARAEYPSGAPGAKEDVSAKSTILVNNRTFSTPLLRRLNSAATQADPFSALPSSFDADAAAALATTSAKDAHNSPSIVSSPTRSNNAPSRQTAPTASSTVYSPENNPPIAPSSATIAMTSPAASPLAM